MIRKVVGCVLLVLSIGASIYIGEIVMNHGLKIMGQDESFGPLAGGFMGLQFCWLVGAVGWFLCYPRKRMNFRQAAGWFLLATGTWLTVFWSILFASSSGRPVVYVVVSIFTIVVVLIGLWLILPKKRKRITKTSIKPPAKRGEDLQPPSTDL